MKKRANVLISILLITAILASMNGCATKKQTVSVTRPIIEDAEFGGTYADISIEDFNKEGFKYGDSCSVEFSNGYKLTNVPYYDGYYERTNYPLIVAYPGYEHVLIQFCSGDSMWKVANCKAGESVTITRTEQGTFLTNQEALSTVYSNERKDFSSDAVFANFRVMEGGAMKEGKFYRGASPANNQYSRAKTTDSLLKQNGIQFVLDLADTDEKIQGYFSKEDYDSDYFSELYQSGKVAPLGLNASYRGDSFRANLVEGLRKMVTFDGPCYIHCTEGKDRTGFVCILLEALCGASFDDMENDYFITYDNYYGITKEKDPERYNALYEIRFMDMMTWLADAPADENLQNTDFRPFARKYLTDSGMTEAEVDNLVQYLCES